VVYVADLIRFCCYIYCWQAAENGDEAHQFFLLAKGADSKILSKLDDTTEGMTDEEVEKRTEIVESTRRHMEVHRIVFMEMPFLSFLLYTTGLGKRWSPHVMLCLEATEEQ
jgi:hypothetical protein